MKIKLKRLNIENFKGIKKQEIEFSDSTQIYGKNASGKTTVFDAMLWGIFGRDSQNKADFEIKTLDESGAVKHNLDHSVEMAIDVDGKEIVLKKVYKEKWTKKRGQAQSELTGHTTDHSVDGVPVKKSEYQAQIDGLIDEKLFRLLTDARHFNESLHWSERRNILVALCGGVDESKIDGYDLIKAFLGERTVEQQKKVVAAQKKEINKQLLEIPARIDELSKQLITEAGSKQDIENQIKEIEKKRDALSDKIAASKTDGGYAERQQKIAAIETEILNKENSFNRDRQSRIDAMDRHIREANDAIYTIDTEAKNKKTGAENLQVIISGKGIELEKIRADWKEMANLEQKIETVCPTCEQPLPAEKVEQTIERANVVKSEKLKELRESGVKMSELISELEGQLSKIWPGEDTEKQKEILLKNISDFQTEVEKIKSTQPDLAELTEKKNTLDGVIRNPVGVAEDENKITRLTCEILDRNKLLLDIQKNKDYGFRISELESQEKKLSQEFADLERQLFLIENFIKAKVGSVEGTINGMFKISKFKLFHEQVNGGIDEVCETMLNGVPYGSINNAGKIQTGMDVINTLQQFYGVQCPVFIDNRESVTELPETECQTISLYVSPEDDVMRVENN